MCLPKAMDNNPNETTKNPSSVLLELAANNDVEGFKQFINSDSCSINEAGLWYYRHRASKQMVRMERTPLMVAAIYGSVDVVGFILSLSEVDVNRSCKSDNSTALHCASSSGCVAAIDVVKLLILAGADLYATDYYGHRPCDIIVSPPKLPHLKVILEEILKCDESVCQLSSIPSSPSFDSTLLPATQQPNDVHSLSASEKKEYPIDPSIPDIKNGIYSTDEFRMFSFKIQPCSRYYSHDWTECPFVHPGENARRRDPKKFHYSCVPCPDHRNERCRRGDSCEYAHGIFESLLHPAQYRTQLCRDGTSCTRRVCFFAHTIEELRQSPVPSRHSGSATSATTAIDTAAALNFFPGSLSAPVLMSPGNGMSWPQLLIPTLDLPGSHLQMSPLRSFNARNFGVESLRQQQLLTPLNLNYELFSSSVLSPRYSVSSSSHNSSVLNRLQQQESMLSRLETSLSSQKFENASSLGVSLPGMMSSLSIEPQVPLRSRVHAFANPENQPQEQLGSFSSGDFGSRTLTFQDMNEPDATLVKQSPSDIQ